MALVLILLLIGFAATLTLFVQTSTASALRLARKRHLRTLIRLAACDAAWHFLKEDLRTEIPKLGSGSSGSLARTTLPSGIETRLRMFKVLGAEKQMLSRAGGGDPDADIYLIQTQAAVSGLTEKVSCFVQHNDKNELQVLGWLENR